MFSESEIEIEWNHKISNNLKFRNSRFDYSWIVNFISFVLYISVNVSKLTQLDNKLSWKCYYRWYFVFSNMISSTPASYELLESSYDNERLVYENFCTLSLICHFKHEWTFARKYLYDDLNNNENHARASQIINRWKILR